MTNTEIVKALGAIKSVRDILDLGIMPSESVIEEMNKAVNMLDEYVYEKVSNELIEEDNEEHMKSKERKEHYADYSDQES